MSNDVEPCDSAVRVLSFDGPLALTRPPSRLPRTPLRQQNHQHHQPFGGAGTAAAAASAGRPDSGDPFVGAPSSGASLLGASPPVPAATSSANPAGPARVAAAALRAPPSLALGRSPGTIAGAGGGAHGGPAKARPLQATWTAPTVVGQPPPPRRGHVAVPLWRRPGQQPQGCSAWAGGRSLIAMVGGSKAASVSLKPPPRTRSRFQSVCVF